MKTRWMLVVLAAIALALQAQLWFSDAGFSKTRKLRAAVAEQREQNAALQTRNQALDAEVLQLPLQCVATGAGLVGADEPCPAPTLPLTCPAGDGGPLVRDLLLTNLAAANEQRRRSGACGRPDRCRWYPVI